MKKGEITVFLALTLSILLSIIVGTIESVRVNTIRFQIECAMDVGLYSALAEYNRELLDQYELFFVDTSYGKDMGNLEYTEKHIREFLDYNLQPQKEIVLPNYKDFYGMSVQEVTIMQASIATDNQCEVLRSQAIAYMKDKTGFDILEQVSENFNIFHKYSLEKDTTKQREENQNQIDAYNHTKVEVGENQWKEVEIDNPADEVNLNRESGVLSVVTEGGETLSGATVSLSNYVSHRELNVGNGLAPGIDSPTGIEDEVFFGEYILQKFGNYTETFSKSHLKYQVEYVLEGKSNDIENLRSTVNKLLLLRESANYIYLQGDAAKKAEVTALATSVSAVLLIPELGKLIEQAILFAWAYAESVNDVKILLENGKIPLMKKNQEWRISLVDMPVYKKCLDSGEKGTEGLSYKDYLRLLLMLTNKQEKVMRVADVIEMDLRKTKGNHNFRMDACMDSMEVMAVVTSSYGYEYYIKRRYGYEMLS